MLKRYALPGNIIWAAVHICLIFVGLLIIKTAAFEDYVGPEAAISIGVSIFATGIVGVFLFLYILATDNARARLQALDRAGLIDAFSTRSVTIRSEYDRRLRNAKRIDVVGYGLGSFTEDYAREFANWSQRATVRLVAIDPEAPGDPAFSDIRDLEEAREPGKTRDDVLRLKQILSDNRDINRENFHCRLMTCIPSLNIMIVDNEAIWGPYLLDEQSRNTFAFVSKRGGYVFEALDAHFEKLWTKYSREIDV